MEPLRRVTHDEIEAFWRDGVVCLRSILPVDLVDAMSGPVEAALVGPETADMSALSDAVSDGGDEVLVDRTGPEPFADLSGSEAFDDDPMGRGLFRSGVDHWRVRPEFRDFACGAPIPGIAADVLRSDQVNLYEDSVLVKEPGTPERTAWHQDLSYFNVDGDQLATLWIPLDAVTTESGAMRFVRGSHLWGSVFQPNLFVSNVPLPGTDGAQVPDIDADPSAFDLVGFELGPGDLTIHHARTLHAAGGNRSERRRRAISLRYCGSDARFRRRPGTVLKAHQSAMSDGDLLDSDDCPVVWRRSWN